MTLGDRFQGQGDTSVEPWWESVDSPLRATCVAATPRPPNPSQLPAPLFVWARSSCHVTRSLGSPEIKADDTGTKIEIPPVSYKAACLKGIPGGGWGGGGGG